MRASDSFVEFLREQLAPLGRVDMRRMFGVQGVYCSGLMFGLITDDTLFLRVDDGNRDIFGDAEATPPLTYERRGRIVDLPFRRVPDGLLDETDELVAWARAALAAAARVAAKRGGKAGRRKSTWRPARPVKRGA